MDEKLKPCKVELTYFNSDDGVWLKCACGWEHNLGFCADPINAAELSRAHLNTVRER